ncbi:hypothetical protein AAHC03_01863 [Spirometra sp. Aus1]
MEPQDECSGKETMEFNCSKELIFLQAGPASNWVGTHFWNLQEGAVIQADRSPLWPSVLFRAQETSHHSSTLSLTPRLIAVDVLGSVRSPELDSPGTDGQMPRPKSADLIAWSGDVQTIRKDTAVPQGVERNSQPWYWTDCLLPAVKRRWRGEQTAFILRDYLDASMPSDSLASPATRAEAVVEAWSESPSYLTSFTQGAELFRPDSDAFDELETRFRRLAEECDSPSGFVLLADSDSGFAGVALRLGEYVGEEFAKRPLLTCPLASVQQRQQQQGRRRWSTVCLNRLSLYSSLEAAAASGWPTFSAWLPLGAAVPEAVSGPSSCCCLAATLSAALATVLAPVQLRSHLPFASDLHTVLGGLTPTRKKMLTLSFASFPSKSPAVGHSQPNWMHLNPLASCPLSRPTDSAQVPSLPCSLAFQLATCGLESDVSNALLKPPNPDSRPGCACSLMKGMKEELVASLPDSPQIVPRPPDKSFQPFFPCTQPSINRTAVCLEALSHCSAEDQWLSTGLRHHLAEAFIHKFHTDQEVDDLRERRELVVERLVEAYASQDG